MATVRFKNVSTDPIYLSELYINLDTEDEIEVERSIGELTAMVGLQSYIRSGAIEQTLLSIPDEEAAYLLAGAEVTSGTNIGTGAGQVFKAMSGYSLQFRTIKAGSNITVTNNTEDITLAASSPGEVNTASNLGAGQGIFSQKSGVDLQFKSLIAGSNVTITPTDTDITIASSGGGSGEANTASNLGTGNGLYRQKSGVDLQFKSLIAGSNITLTPTDNDITIAATGGGSGEANTASNLGTGNGVYRQKVGVDLQFKSFIAGSNVTITPTDNDLTIAAATPGEVNTASNVGSGEGQVFKQKSGVDLQLKSIKAGSGILVTNNASDIEISNAVLVQDDFFVGDYADTQYNDYIWKYVITGSSNSITILEDAYGIMQLGAGTSSTTALVGGTGMCVLKEDSPVFECRVTSDAAIGIACGLTTSNSGTDVGTAENSVRFVTLDDSGTVKWALEISDGLGSYEQSILNSPLPTTNYDICKIQLNTTDSLALFYINGALVGALDLDTGTLSDPLYPFIRVAA